MGNGKAKWWHWLPVSALVVYTLQSGDVRGGVVCVLILGVGLFTQYGSSAPRPLRRWAAYALNWSAPAFVVALVVHRALAQDYWGVAFFSIFFGFALVNAAFLEPSPQRTMLYRTLIGLFALVSMAAIWKTLWP